MGMTSRYLLPFIPQSHVTVVSQQSCDHVLFLEMWTVSLPEILELSRCLH